METSTRLGLFIFIGFVVGAIIGRWYFNTVIIGPFVGAALFGLLAWVLDKRAKN